MKSEMRLDPRGAAAYPGSRMLALGAAAAVYSLLALAACSEEQAQRYGYDLGNQYQCTQDAQNLPDESSRSLACISPAQSGRPSFETYRKQTEADGKQP